MTAHRPLTTPTRLLATALFLVAAAAFNLPKRLYLFLSADKQLGGSSLVEIQTLNFLSIAAAVGLLLMELIEWRSRGAAWRIALEADYRALCAAPQAPASRRRAVAYAGFCLLITAGLLATIRWSFSAYGQNILAFEALAQEHGLWESATAAFLLLAGLLLIRSALAVSADFNPRWMLLAPIALGLVFITGTGEEINWMQELFGFATPEFLRERNIQHEASLHNMGGYWANQLMILFLLGYGVVLPLLARFFTDVRYAAARLRVPLVPLALLPFSAFALLLDEREFFNKFWDQPPWRLSEARETLFAAVMLCTAIETYNITCSKSFQRRYVRLPLS